MGAAARELENRIVKTIFDAGGRLLERSKDGAGHKVVRYEVAGHTSSFHFANSPSSKTGVLNALARLRRHIREFKAEPIAEIVPEPPLEAAQECHGAPTAPRVEPTPPCPRKLSVKEKLKRYLQMDSIEEFMEEFDLSRAQAEIMIHGSKGQAAEKLRVEEARKRTPPAPIVVRREKPRDLSKAEQEQRNRKIAVYTKYGMTYKEAGDLFGISSERARQIAKGYAHVC